MACNRLLVPLLAQGPMPSTANKGLLARIGGRKSLVCGTHDILQLNKKNNSSYACGAVRCNRHGTDIRPDNGPALAELVEAFQVAWRLAVPTLAFT